MEKIEKEINLKTNLGPYIYLKDSVSLVSVKLMILLSIQIALLVCAKSFDSVAVIFTALTGGLCAAALYFLLFREPVYNSLILINQAIFIGFLLPGSFPPVSVFFISFITLFVYKLFLYKSNPWLTPAALAVLIAWFIGRNYFPSFLMNADLAFSKNPGAALISQGHFPVYSFDTTVTAFLNNYIFSMFKVTVPDGFISMLWDTGSVIPAFRFNLVTVISSVFLFSDDFSRIIVPYTMLIVYGILVRLFVPLIFGGQFNTGDVILAYFTSGTLFCIVFMFNFFGTVPVSLPVKFAFGIAAGILAFLITGFGTSPIGMVYTILICNLINLPLRFIEDKHTYYRYLKKYSVSNSEKAEEK